MAWQTPKTDWYGYVNSDGVYIGDYFNYTDFNRIKNNLEFLHNLAVKLYDSFDIVSIGTDKTTSDYFYADEINHLEQNLNTINTKTINASYGSTPTYSANGYIMDFEELNRLESAILSLYNYLNTQATSRRMFTWNFGIKGGL